MFDVLIPCHEDCELAEKLVDSITSKEDLVIVITRGLRVLPQ